MLEMKRVVKRKKIIILHKGVIHPLGISGPHLVPYWETTDVINKLIMGNYKVAEVLKDGTQIRLDYTNYDRENGDPNDPSMQVTYETYKSLNVRRRDQANKVQSIDEIDTRSEMQKMLKRSTETKPANQNTEKLVDAEKILIGDKSEKHKKNKYIRPEIDATDDKD